MDGTGLEKPTHAVNPLNPVILSKAAGRVPGRGPRLAPLPPTPPPAKPSFAPKCVPKPEFGNAGRNDERFCRCVQCCPKRRPSRTTRSLVAPDDACLDPFSEPAPLPPAKPSFALKCVPKLELGNEGRVFIVIYQKRHQGRLMSGGTSPRSCRIRRRTAFSWCVL